MARYGSKPGRVALDLVGVSLADAATFRALPADAKQRVNGSITAKLDDSSLWVFDEDGTAVEQDGIIEPTAGAGQWLRASAGGAGSAGATQSLHSVRGASTTNIATLATFTVAGVDGLTYVEGERILLKDQSSADENGIYVVGVVAGGTAALTRAVDADDAAEVSPGMLTIVAEGTVSADDWYYLTTNEDITVDTTNLTFVKMPSGVDLASVANGDGLSLIGYEDASGFTTAADGEAAMDELYQDRLSVQQQVNVDNLSGGILAAGTPMAAFADNAASQPGVTLVDNEGVAIRWNDNGTQVPVWYRLTLPQKLDSSANAVLHFLVSKTGATLGDATTLTVTAFFQTPGALHDADADLGGTTDAITGDDAAKTVTEITLALSAANIPAGAKSLSFSIQPTDGLLGTDDFMVQAIWCEFTGALLTS